MGPSGFIISPVIHDTFDFAALLFRYAVSLQKRETETKENWNIGVGIQGLWSRDCRGEDISSRFLRDNQKLAAYQRPDPREF
jgi:hypothetical protein